MSTDYSLVSTPRSARGGRPSVRAGAADHGNASSSMPAVISRGGGADEHRDEQRLMQEVDFLQKKIKYLQSVSTIFRQKIALIMRECSKNPTSFPEYHRMYAKVVGEVVKAEEALSGEKSDFAQIASYTAAAAIEGRPSAEQREKRRDDVDKAHQLCRILQEKNELKQKEVELREKYDDLLVKYEDVNERHTRLLELQSTGASGGLAQAQMDAFRAKEKALEQALMQARQANAQAIATRDSSPLPHTASLADGINPLQPSDSVLAKQNQLLKSRVEKLKKELSDAVNGAEQNSRQLQLNVETLAAQLHSTKHELQTKDIVVQRARAARDEMATELTRERGLQELLQQKVESMEAEITHLRAALRGEDGAGSTMTGGASVITYEAGGAGGGKKSGAVTVRDADDAGDLVQVYKLKLERAEADREKLQKEVWRLDAEGVQKDIEIASLGAQIKAFRARVESFETEQVQRDMQRNMVADVERRVADAVATIQQSQTTANLTNQMGAVGERLQKLEGLELQLRQKEDLLALAEDELSQLRQTHAELQESLQAVSSLFLQLPKSTASLERLVIEHAEYRAEVHRAADAREPPDVVAVNGRIELRCLEAEAARRESRGKDAVARNVAELMDNAGWSPAAGQTSRGASTAAVDDHLQRPGDYGVGDDSAVPQPPPLMDLSAALNDSRVPGRRSGRTSHGHADPAASGLGGFADGSSPPSGAGAGSVVSEDDVRITFQLFDERGTGVLPADVIRLCLTTLGLPPSLLPSSARSLTAAEFLALCSSRTRGE